MRERVFITGASSGLGAGLAQRYARPGVTVGLVARRTALLEEVARRVEMRGARALQYAVDVVDTNAMRQACSDYLKRCNGADLVIANAGTSRPDYLEKGNSEQVAHLFRVNVVGVANTIIPFIPAMLDAGSGMLVAVGSIAGFRGLPGHAAYCASKAAVSTFMEGVRMDLVGRGVHAMTLCPGFVLTEMTRGASHPTPFMMDVERAVDVMVQAIDARRRTYSFPRPMLALKMLMRLAPEGILTRVIQNGQRPKPQDRTK